MAHFSLKLPLKLSQALLCSVKLSLKLYLKLSYKLSFMHSLRHKPNLRTLKNSLETHTDRQTADCLLRSCRSQKMLQEPAGQPWHGAQEPAPGSWAPRLSSAMKKRSFSHSLTLRPINGATRKLEVALEFKLHLDLHLNRQFNSARRQI